MMISALSCGDIFVLLYVLSAVIFLSVRPRILADSMFIFAVIGGFSFLFSLACVLGLCFFFRGCVSVGSMAGVLCVVVVSVSYAVSCTIFIGCCFMCLCVVVPCLVWTAVVSVTRQDSVMARMRRAGMARIRAVSCWIIYCMYCDFVVFCFDRCVGVFMQAGGSVWVL